MISRGSVRSVESNLDTSGRLRKVHGTAKNRGVRPSHHVDASGSIDRKVLQALEKIGVVEQDEEKGGRRITQSGQLSSVTPTFLVARANMSLGQRDLDRKTVIRIDT
jgi:ribosomal protein S19E (S16A)